MPILNYTTKIDSRKTVGEIQQILGQHGAHGVSTSYIDKEAAAIYFSLDVSGVLVNFRLPCNFHGVLEVFKKDKKVPRSAYTYEQARRTAWRIVKNWVEAQMAIIESGQAQMVEVFLPYAVNQNGATLFEQVAATPRLLLGYEAKEEETK